MVIPEPELLPLALGVCLLAGLVHGAFGLGFPLVATPLLALMTDVKTAILLTLAPNIAVNLWSLVRGGGWRERVARYWPVALWMLAGSAVGTLLLAAMDPNPFRLL
ncbi:MAG: sulfite exporter TauE/SafE family protein, partial [Ectothiorhodospira sp.]